MYRIDILLKQEQKLFHTQDLALLWGIDNKNTLYTTIKRYVKKGILIPIYKGYYSTIPINAIDPFRLGLGYLHTYGYISTETVLVKQGILFQGASSITLISSISKSFTIGDNTYVSRKIADTYLYNNAGIIFQSGVQTATLERAVVDILYLRPRFHLDNEKAIDWKKVKELQTCIGYL